MLGLLHAKIVGHTVKIRAAPPSITLQMFGGNMSIEEYRYGFLRLPPNTAMYDDAKKADLITRMSENCEPEFPRVLIQKYNHKLSNEASIPEQDRHMPLRTATLQSSMGMNTSIA